MDVIMMRLSVATATCVSVLMAGCVGFVGSKGRITSSDPANGDLSNGEPMQGDGGEPRGTDQMSGGDNGDLVGDSSDGDLPPGAFEIRRPQLRYHSCFPTGFWDVDHVCLLRDLSVEVYVQASPVSPEQECELASSAVPPYVVVGAWSKIGGVVTPIGATYGYGGQHHSDVIDIMLGQTIYVLWHSSIGTGARTCAPADCFLTCGDGATFDSCDQYSGYEINGCARARGEGPPAQRAICVRVNADGTVPPLLDPWLVQEGYPDYPLLPCAGE
jgi:hypothetical protein